jgi:hypothetical protein
VDRRDVVAVVAVVAVVVVVVVLSGSGARRTDRVLEMRRRLGSIISYFCLILL